MSSWRLCIAAPSRAQCRPLRSSANGQTFATMLRHLLPNVDWDFVTSRPHFDGSFYVVAELRDGEWVCLRWGEETVLE